MFWHELCYCKFRAKKTVLISVVANENDKRYQVLNENDNENCYQNDYQH